MGLSRQEYWSGLPFPPSGDLPNPGDLPDSVIEPTFWALQVDSLPRSHLQSLGKLFCLSELSCYQGNGDTKPLA